MYQYAPRNILEEHSDPEANLKNQHAWLSTFILCRQAGIAAGFPRELDVWQDRKLIFCPAPLTNTGGYHLYVPFWRQIMPWVRDGGHLYASISAMSALSIPYSAQLFGAAIEDRLPWRADITISFVEEWHGIQPGESFQFQARDGLDYTGAMLQIEGARVLARDQDGNAALVAFDCGQGSTALCAYPIEMMLGATPNALEEGSSYWRLYRALKEWAGIHSPYVVADPAVEVGLLSGVGRSYVVLTNHSSQTVEGQVVGAARQVTMLGADGPVAVQVQDGGWRYRLEGFSGTIYGVIPA